MASFDRLKFGVAFCLTTACRCYIWIKRPKQSWVAAMVSAIDWDVLVRPNQCLENCTTSISWRLLLLIRSWKHFKSSRRLLLDYSRQERRRG